jgi:hypothetical protein
MRSEILSYLAMISGVRLMDEAGMLPFIWVVDRLQTDILLVLKSSVELGVLPVEGQLGSQVVNVLLDKLAVAF